MDKFNTAANDSRLTPKGNGTLEGKNPEKDGLDVSLEKSTGLKEVTPAPGEKIDSQVAKM